MSGDEGSNRTIGDTIMIVLIVLFLCAILGLVL